MTPEDQNINPLIWAFVQGAKWWQWELSGRPEECGGDGGSSTMWQSDQRLAGAEAQRLLDDGRLGRNPEEVMIERLKHAQDPQI